MNVGIITFNETSNYGAALQTYALNRTINEMGVNCETIRYRCKNIWNRERPLNIESKKTIKELIATVLLYRVRKKRFQNINSFLEKNSMMSKKLFDAESIFEANNYYDTFVAGSDIIWETRITDSDYTYYLDFVNDSQKRISYAASFGSNSVPEKEVAKCLSHLKKFYAISVREYNAIDIIKDMKADIPVRLTCDPTFLINREDWNEIACAYIPYQREDYVFVYFMDKDGILLGEAKKYAEKHRKKLIVFNERVRHINGAYNIRNMTVKEFLSWIRNAYMIFTGSYHATCFAIIFERNFVFLNRAHPDRLLSLAKVLGFENQDLGRGRIDSEVDYQTINNRLDDFRRYSQDFLRDVLM